MLTTEATGNAGLGKEAALQLAKHNPSRIFIGSRSEKKAQVTIAEIVAAVPTAQLSAIQMDLASLASVAKAAIQIMAMTPRLDILMNNAGIMAVPAQCTVNGYEIQFGTNYVGHALLTKLLLPMMLETAKDPSSDVRVINLTPHSHARAPEGGINFPKLHSADPGTAPLTKYGQSKLANILHTKALAKRYPSIKTIAIHPGMVNTGLSTTMRRSFLLARVVMPAVAYFSAVGVKQGVLNQLWGATSADSKNGEYYEPVGVGGMGSVYTKDTELAEKLWEWTEKELECYSS